MNNADMAREIVSMMIDCDFSIDHYEFIQKELTRFTSGELKAKVEDQMMKMDEEEEERKQEEAIYADSLAYDAAMDQKIDEMREDRGIR